MERTSHAVVPAGRINVTVYQHVPGQLAAVYDYMPDDGWYDLIPTPQPDPDEEPYVLLKWESNETGDDHECTLSEYFPTFEAGLHRLFDLEGNTPKSS